VHGSLSAVVCRLAALVAATLVVGAAANVSQARQRAGDGRGGAAGQEQVLARLIARGLPVFCSGGRRREVALSFDDGPGRYSRQLLSELHGVRATFFLIGRNVPDDPQVVRAEARLDAVGDHTQDHTVLTGLPTAAVRAEIARGKASIQAAAGKPVQLLRPPGDHWDSTITASARAQGLLAVGYTVDPRDWTLRTRQQVITAVLSDPRLVPGAIVLLHETRASTIDSVPAIVAALHRRRLKLVTIPQLLTDDPPTQAEQQADLAARSCVHLYERRPRARLAAASAQGRSDRTSDPGSLLGPSLLGENEELTSIREAPGFGFPGPSLILSS
jgi:peptidoglycan/xylan/chitin deacetylase (PgdA/CDA1 family)